MPVGERAAETADDLKAAGSQTIGTAQAIKTAAVAVTGVSAASGTAQQTLPAPDLIGTTKDVVSEVHSWKAITDLIAETTAWTVSHLWILGIVAGFAFWKWGRTVEARRLLAHQLGFDLSK
jgi:hypothetical protein